MQSLKIKSERFANVLYFQTLKSYAQQSDSLFDVDFADFSGKFSAHFPK